MMLLGVFIGISLCLLLILRLKIPAFIALLVASIATGLLCGMAPLALLDTMKKGMGDTLGIVATIVGLGSIFGGILEKTNGANIISQKLLKIFGEKNAPIALMLSGFMVAIPVFFDVGFIILFPIIYALHHKTGKSIIYYAVPLLAGLAVTHACIPPTPGPIAVTEILKADMAWVIGLGFIIGLPMAYCGGMLYGKYIGGKLDIRLDQAMESDKEQHNNDSLNFPSFTTVLAILILPIVLIIIGTIGQRSTDFLGQSIANIIGFIGHPFVALIVANFAAWYLLGKRSGFTSAQLTQISAKSLQPAGIIILVTGAGGVYKQTLIDTGAGIFMAEQMQDMGLSIIVFAFMASMIIRVLQGSATIAMITGAGLVAPLLVNFTLNDGQLACLVIAISSGATMASHLNDSGFWLVKEYLKLSEKDGMKTWTIASSIIGLVGFVLSTCAFYILG